MTNVNTKKYKDYTFSTNPSQVCWRLPSLVQTPWETAATEEAIGDVGLQAVDAEHHSWANYFLAAYKVSHALLPRQLMLPSNVAAVCFADNMFILPGAGGL